VTSSPTVTTTPTSIPTVTPTATPIGYKTVTPTPSPTITPESYKTVTPTVTPTSTTTITPPKTPAATPTLTPQGYKTITPTPSPTVTPTNTPTPSPSSSPIPSPSASPTCDPSTVFSFNLNSFGKRINMVSLPGYDFRLNTAEDLADQVGRSCTVVSYWDEVNQAYVPHPHGFPLFDFDLTPGYAYFVTVDRNDNFNFVGCPLDPWPTYTLITTPTTNINDIVVPLDRTDLTTAEELAEDIGSACTVITKWDATDQAYVPHPVGYPLFNFEVTAGYPYFATVSEGISWP